MAALDYKVRVMGLAKDKPKKILDERRIIKTIQLSLKN